MKTLTALCVLAAVGSCAAVFTWTQGIDKTNPNLFVISGFEPPPAGSPYPGIVHTIPISCADKFVGNPQFPKLIKTGSFAQIAAIVDSDKNFNDFIGKRGCKRQPRGSVGK